MFHIQNIRHTKYFVCLIFVGKGRQWKFFNDENFLIYDNNNIMY